MHRGRLDDDVRQHHAAAVREQGEREGVIRDAVVVAVHHEGGIAGVAHPVVVLIGLAVGVRDDRRVGNRRAVVEGVGDAVGIEVVVD